jgi:ElaB/YqjD/DUF883 family membrane-anchored ribosome-binding protein
MHRKSRMAILGAVCFSHGYKAFHADAACLNQRSTLMFSTATKEYAAATKESATDDVRDAASRAKRDARNTADRTEDNVVNAAESAGRKVRDFIDEASEKIHTATDKVTSEVNHNPMQSTLAALGIGFVLGMLFRR